MLKWSSKQAGILRKIEENEREKRQHQFKNNLEKAGKKEHKIIKKGIIFHLKKINQK